MTVPCAYTDTPRSTLPSVAAPLLCFILPVACCTLHVRRASPRRAGRAGDSDLLEHGRAQLALVLLTPSLHHCTECEYAAADKKPWPCHICTGTGLAPATSAPGLGSPLPHLHRDSGLPEPSSTTRTAAARVSGPCGRCGEPGEGESPDGAHGVRASALGSCTGGSSEPPQRRDGRGANRRSPQSPACARTLCSARTGPSFMFVITSPYGTGPAWCYE